jgi:hypothetical protein
MGGTWMGGAEPAAVVKKTVEQFLHLASLPNFSAGTS